MIALFRFMEAISNRKGGLKRVFLLFPSLILCCFSTVLAHPHVFIDNYVTVVFDKKGLAGFKLKWVFDEMTGTGFIMDYDANQDGLLDKQEEKTLKAEAFDNLRNYNYMTSISIDGKDFNVQYVKDFFAETKNNTLSYNFFIPCHVSAIAADKQVRVAVFDEEYFIDYALDKNIKVQTPGSVAYNYKIKKNLDKTFYLGQINPTEIVLRFKKK